VIAGYRLCAVSSDCAGAKSTRAASGGHRLEACATGSSLRSEPDSRVFRPAVPSAGIV